jgi:hypothetical protein
MSVLQPWAGICPRAGDDNNGDNRTGKRPEHPRQRPLAGQRPLERGEPQISHNQSLGAPRIGVIDARVEAILHPGMEKFSARRPITVRAHRAIVATATHGAR